MNAGDRVVDAHSRRSSTAHAFGIAEESSLIRLCRNERRLWIEECLKAKGKCLILIKSRSLITIGSKMIRARHLRNKVTYAL
jgi:hypothetical protein